MQRHAETQRGLVRDIDQISGDVLDAAIRLHKDLGPGLLESVYETLLAAQISRMGYEVVQQYPVPLDYDGFHFPAAYKIDLLVDGRLLIEIKSVDQLHASHAKQLLTYLRIFKQPVGLLINFGGATLKEGFRRLVNDYVPIPASPTATIE